MRAIIGRFVLLAVAMLVVVGPSRVPVEAETYEYTPKKRQVKACILLLESFALANPDPHVFYVLDSEAKGTAKGLRPRDWEIVNPLAPHTVTPDIKARWDAIDPGHPYALDQPVAKSMACYWEVPLAGTSIEDLLQFDLVAVIRNGTGGFNAEDSGKLRRLADLGVTLWFDDSQGAALGSSQPFFIRDFNFDYVGAVANPGSPAVVAADYLHPMLNSPFRMTAGDLEQLGNTLDQYAYRITNLPETGLPDPLLAPIVFTQASFGDGIRYPVTAGGHYGDGAVLATSGGIGSALNDRLNAGPNALAGNAGAFCGDLPATWDDNAQTRLECNMKFVFNALNWTASESNHRHGARGTAHSRDEVTPGLDTAWKLRLCATTPGGPVPQIVGPAAAWRDFAFFATREPGAGGWVSRVFAVDTLPHADRDGDGLGNDGTPAGWVDAETYQWTPDLTAQAPYDVIWRWDCPVELREPPSAMFVATVVVGGVPVDALLFTTVDTTGRARLHALQATPRDPGTGALLMQTAGLPNYYTVPADPGVDITTGLAPGDAVSPPVVSRGQVYVLARKAGDYTMHVLDALTGSVVQSVGLGSTALGDTAALPAPSVGLIHNERTGGATEMAYITQADGVVQGVPLRVYEEIADPKETIKPNFVADNDPLVFRLQHAPPRAAGVNDGDPVPPGVLRAEVYDASGAFVATANAYYKIGPQIDPREIEISMSPGNTPISTDQRVFVEYTVDPTIGVALRQWQQAELGPVGLLSGPVLTGDDGVCFASGNGFVQFVRERGQGGTSRNDANQVVWRHNVNTYDANAQRTDQTWIPAWYDTVAGRWVSLPPAVSDDMVYVAMNLYDPTTNPPTGVEGALFAFDRRARLQIDTGWWDTTGANALDMTSPELKQYAPEEDRANPPLRNINPANWRLHSRRETRTVAGQPQNRCVFEFETFNRDSNAHAPLTVNPTLPVLVVVDPDGNGPLPPVTQPFYFNNYRSGNLVWKYPDGDRADGYHNLVRWTSGVVAPPTVSGGVVYVATGDGTLFGLDADPRDGGKSVLGAPPASIRLIDDGKSDFGWGLLALDLPRVWPPIPPDPVPAAPERVPADVVEVWSPGITVSPGSPAPAVTTASGLVLMARNEADAGTLYALHRPVYTVADARRRLEVDGDGRVLRVMAEAKGPSDELALNHPAAGTLAEHLAEDRQAMIFADTGNDRVVAVGRGGEIVWQATEVYDLDGVLPDRDYTVAQSVRVPMVPANASTPEFLAGNVRVAKLRTPTDVRAWQSYETGQVAGQPVNVKVHHTLVADAGNYRAMEVVDKWYYDTLNRRWVRYPRNTGEFWYHVVVWASQTQARHQDTAGQWQLGRNYRYTSIEPVETVQGYTKRALCAVSNYALSFPQGGRRMERAGASLVLLDGTYQAAPSGYMVCRSSIVDKPNERGYVCAIGQQADPTASPPRPFSGKGIIRSHYSQKPAGAAWHYVYADSTGIYEWSVLQGGTILPRDTDGNLGGFAAGRLYSQFWRENYAWFLNDPLDPNNGDKFPGGDPYQFQPGAVWPDPVGGWVVVNRVFDKKLSAALRQPQRPRDSEARRIQIFKVNATPAPYGDYLRKDAGGQYEPNFGYSAGSIRMLFGPELRDARDIRRPDLKMDLSQPVCAVRVR